MTTNIQAGTSIVDISPRPGVPLSGYPHNPRPNTGIHDPLFASCLYLHDGSTALALVCMDLVGISKKHVSTVRRRVAEQSPIPAENIMISCSHTHSAPRACGSLDLESLEKGVKPDVHYVQGLQDKLVSLIIDASQNTFSASIGIGMEYCGREEGVGGNRRNPQGIADPEVWVIAVRDATNSLRCCLVKYSLHPTVLHADNFEVSADYPAYIRQYFQHHHPSSIVLFAQGTSGNQSSRYFRKSETFKEAERIGTTIAEKADQLLSSLHYSNHLPLTVLRKEIDIDVKTLPPRRDVEKRIQMIKKELEEKKRQNASSRDIWNTELLLYGEEDTLAYIHLEERGERLEALYDETPAEVQVIGIGDTRIVALQGEVFVEFGITIEYRSPFTNIFVVTLANGVMPGYACTRRAYSEGGYETGASMLTGRSGEQLVETAVELLFQSAT
jgi:hypothetical protein